VPDDDFPIRLGTAEDFARVRAFLAGVGLAEPQVCAALKLDHIGELIEPARDGIHLDALPRPLAFAIRVFVQGARVRDADGRAACGEAVLAAFRTLGLLAPVARGGLLECPVWLYPADGFLIVSDRHRDAAGRRIAAAPDAVFAACFEGTLHFLRLLPHARGGDALDLCGGTGIGALHLARTAARAATADVTARAAHFAAFNARLNAVAVESLCGDLYAAVGERRFDLITCHPPYLPAGGEPSLARDGGETGEDLTRRTVAGLPAHLRVGGLCLVASLGCDFADAPFEQRARRWLGAAAAEFAVAFGEVHTRSIEEVVGGLARRGGGEDDAEVAGRIARLHALGVTRFVYGALALRRRAKPDAAPPRRVALAPDNGSGDLLALIG
jgi:release factor glutamine methyltransferase